MNSPICSIDTCKRTSDILCIHCQNRICTKHYIEHVKTANGELATLSDELGTLIDKADKYEIPQAIFQCIEQWREESHRRIDTICDERKRQIKMELNRRISTHTKKLDELIQDVNKLIAEGDASLKQIASIKNSIAKCREECEQLETLDNIHFNIKGNDLEVKLFNEKLFTGGGTLLSMVHQLKLNEFYGKKGQQWMLLYKATRDGFSGIDFHQCCDDQGPTMIVIQSRDGGYLFGGYTSASWRPQGKYVVDLNEPFLFTLTNPHGIPPTKYAIKNPQYSIFPQMNCGPIFGGGNDLYCCSDSDVDRKSYFHFPHSYDDTTSKGSLTFTGEKNFRTHDIEVYRLMEAYECDFCCRC